MKLLHAYTNAACMCSILYYLNTMALCGTSLHCYLTLCSLYQPACSSITTWIFALLVCRSRMCYEPTPNTYILTNAPRHHVHRWTAHHNRSTVALFTSFTDTISTYGMRVNGVRNSSFKAGERLWIIQKFTKRIITASTPKSFDDFGTGISSHNASLFIRAKAVLCCVCDQTMSEFVKI